MDNIKDFITDNLNGILALLAILTVVVGVTVLIIKWVNLEKTINRQPSVMVIGVITNKHYIPESQELLTIYNSNTKQNDISTVYKSEEYRTNILLLDTEEMITKYDKQTYIRFNERDSLLLEVKRYNSHTRVKKISKYKGEIIDSSLNNEF